MRLSGGGRKERREVFVLQLEIIYPRKRKSGQEFIRQFPLPACLKCISNFKVCLHLIYFPLSPSDDKEDQ